MESTSIYWIPVWRTLQSGFSLKLANPYFIKQLPGRKSDVKGAHWVGECLQKELIKGSKLMLFLVAGSSCRISILRIGEIVINCIDSNCITLSILSTLSNQNNLLASAKLAGTVVTFAKLKFTYFTQNK
jgi:hypothetical protein